MEDWVRRAIKRWPNVPHLYGWLRLDRRGRWFIKGEPISRPQIIDTINRNYASEDGKWFFQNGPQRGYVQLEHAPLVLRASASNELLTTHSDLPVGHVSEVLMDETGALLMRTEHGPAALIDDELEWALQRMTVNGRAIQDDQLATALALASGELSAITLRLGLKELGIMRLNADAAPAYLGFVRDPQPQP